MINKNIPECLPPTVSQDVIDFLRATIIKDGGSYRIRRGLHVTPVMNPGETDEQWRAYAETAGLENYIGKMCRVDLMEPLAYEKLKNLPNSVAIYLDDGSPTPATVVFPMDCLKAVTPDAKRGEVYKVNYAPCRNDLVTWANVMDRYVGKELVVAYNADDSPLGRVPAFVMYAPDRDNYYVYPASALERVGEPLQKWVAEYPLVGDHSDGMPKSMRAPKAEEATLDLVGESTEKSKPTKKKGKGSSKPVILTGGYILEEIPPEKVPFPLYRITYKQRLFVKAEDAGEVDGSRLRTSASREAEGQAFRYRVERGERDGVDGYFVTKIKRAKEAKT